MQWKGKFSKTFALFGYQTWIFICSKWHSYNFHLFIALFQFGNDLGNSKLWILNVWEYSWIVLTFWCTSQNGQIYFKNLKAKTVRFKVCLTILRYYPLKNQIHKNVNFVKNYNMKYLKKNTFDQRKYSGHSSALHLTYFSPLTSFYTPLKTAGNLWLD